MVDKKVKLKKEDDIGEEALVMTTKRGRKKKQ